jgi:hypothetical protein
MKMPKTSYLKDKEGKIIGGWLLHPTLGLVYHPVPDRA